MKLKMINLFLAVGFMLFSITYGFVNYQNTLTQTEADNLYDMQVLSELNAITKEIADDLNITNANKASNNRTSTSNSPTTDISEINFTNFVDMYTYAIEKYNKASYVYLSVNGTINITGSALGYRIENVPLTLKSTVAKELNERYFSYNLNGILVDGLSEFKMNTTHYSNGVTAYSLYPGQSDITTTPMSAFTTAMNWNMTQLFHLPDAAALSQLSENDYSFYFDDQAKEYVATVNFNVSTFHTNFSNVLKGITGSTKDPDFNAITMNIRVDKYGNFKSITASEDFNVNLKYKTVTVENGRAVTNYTVSFIVLDNGYVPVNNPFEDML